MMEMMKIAVFTVLMGFLGNCQGHAYTYSYYKTGRDVSDVKSALAVLTNQDIKDCTSCSSSAHQIPAKEADINEIRLEFIKSEILKKLKLHEVPNVGKTKPSLPIPMTLTYTLSNPPPDNHNDNDNDNEDQDAKTNEMILLATTESIDACNGSVTMICFGFELPSHVAAEDVNSAQLWIYKRFNLKQYSDSDNKKKKLIFFEVDGNSSIELQTQITQIEEGWIRLDFSKKVKAWLSNEKYRPLLKIKCPTCNFPSNIMPLSVEPGTQPLLVLNFETKIKKKRLKRSINCHAGVRECCREKLYVSFKDVGWDGWVIQPEGYHAYFCTGSCSAASAAASSASLNTSLRRKVFTQTKKVELIPCCAATQHSAMTLIYRVDNQTVTRKTLPNMVVESCGCM